MILKKTKRSSYQRQFGEFFKLKWRISNPFIFVDFYIYCKLHLILLTLTSIIIIQSTGSFFHDRSITLGSLIGVSSIFELSKRSVRVKRAENLKVKKNQKPKTCLFSLCSRDSTDAESVNNNPPSLGHFLAVERRAANECRRRDSPIFYGLDELTRPGSEPNSLFVNGCVAPPPASPWGANRGLEDGNGYGVPMLLSCMCGQATH